jgi:transposase
MGVAVGIDIAKGFHWARAVSTDDSRVLIDRRVDNDPASIQALIDQLEALRGEHGQIKAGIDVIGGIAGLIAAMLSDAGIDVVHVSGLAVNRARQGTVGGEHKSDPRDAAVIADQVRHRRDLRPVQALSDIDAEIRLLVGRRRELVADQTRRISRLRDLLTSIFPDLERVVDPTQKASLQLLGRYATPGEIRQAGRRRLIDHIPAAAVCRANTSKRSPTPPFRPPSNRTRSFLASASPPISYANSPREITATKQRLAALDADLQAALERHPDAALIRSLPGMGATLTAEFIAEAGNITRFPTADQLAAAAGLAPVLKQSGKVRYLKRATTGNRTLKRVFVQSAFCSLSHPTSRAFYTRKRAERKTHHQAVIALARRRVDVLHAMLRNRQPYEIRPAKAA